MSGLSSCPVRALTCTNSPDNSENRCPGCPVTEGCTTQRVAARRRSRPRSTGAGAGGDFRLRTFYDIEEHHTPPTIKEPAGQSSFASRTLIVLRSRVPRFESWRGAPRRRCLKTPPPVQKLRTGSSRIGKRMRVGAAVCRGLWTIRGQSLGAPVQISPANRRPGDVDPSRPRLYLVGGTQPSTPLPETKFRRSTSVAERYLSRSERKTRT